MSDDGKIAGANKSSVDFVLLIWLGSVVSICVAGSYMMLSPLKGGQLPMPEPVPLHKQEFDFGAVRQNASLAHTFRIANSLGRPMRLMAMRPSCGCVSARATEGDIQPDDHADIDVALSAPNKSMRFGHYVVLDVLPASASYVLSVTGKVVGDIDVYPNELSLMVDDGVSNPIRQLSVANFSDRQWKRIICSSDVPWLSVRVERDDVVKRESNNGLQPIETWTVVGLIDVGALTQQTTSATLRISIEDSALQAVDVPVVVYHKQLPLPSPQITISPQRVSVSVPDHQLKRFTILVKNVPENGTDDIQLTVSEELTKSVDSKVVDRGKTFAEIECVIRGPSKALTGNIIIKSKSERFPTQVVPVQILPPTAAKAASA